MIDASDRHAGDLAVADVVAEDDAAAVPGIAKGHSGAVDHVDVDVADTQAPEKSGDEPTKKFFQRFVYVLPDRQLSTPRRRDEKLETRKLSNFKHKYEILLDH